MSVDLLLLKDNMSVSECFSTKKVKRITKNEIIKEPTPNSIPLNVTTVLNGTEWLSVSRFFNNKNASEKPVALKNTQAIVTAEKVISQLVVLLRRLGCLKK